MIVAKIQIYKREIIIRNTISKFLIISLLSKNKKRDKVVFKSRQNLYLEDDSLSKNHINTTQKQTKIDKTTHKLHSPHSFI
jgi:hypothetical protein